MTIKQLANRLIKEIKAFPNEARQSQGDSGPKTSWDEFKEQIQYEEYDSFEIFTDTIRTMVEDEVEDLDDYEVESLHQEIKNQYDSKNIDEKRSDIIDSVVEYIEEEAMSEDIEYRKSSMELIKYLDDDLTIVARVLKQIGPDKYLIHTYSEATGSIGEQGEADLNYLDNENGLERITYEEFNNIIHNLKGDSQ